jgi:hypothetical protein
MEELTGKEVEVITEDMLYRGVLVELGEILVKLQTKEEWVEIPVERVIEIKEAS